ncbi:MAG: hypothetical protein H6678_05585 [Candidatus Delongbacteria bacterium]|nr:hypothetical protein [Candidatus Delongbacteria bacterium]
MTLCVVIRVHDRMQDLETLVNIIGRHWTLPVHRLVVSNGAAAGHRVPDSVRAQVEDLLELEHNAGHIGGNAQLLQAALPRIPAHCPFTLLIEADTWLFSDRLLRTYIERLRTEEAVWASALWQDRWRSLALDLALVRSEVLRAHPGILDFRTHAECHVANALEDLGLRWLPLDELMPVHIPSLLRRFWNQWGGRFRCFPEGPMVTHHAEDLPGGFADKLREANRCLGYEEFPVEGREDWQTARRRILRTRTLARLIPRSGWLSRPRRRPGARTPERT